jgi:hypothetical protein
MILVKLGTRGQGKFLVTPPQSPQTTTESIERGRERIAGPEKSKWSGWGNRYCKMFKKAIADPS